MTPQQVADIASPIEFALMAAIAALMGYRIVRHMRNRERVPLLLRRDFGLFALFVLVFVAPRVVRWLTGVTLGMEVWWVVFVNVAAIVVLGYWLAVEVGVVRNGKHHDEDGR